MVKTEKAGSDSMYLSAAEYVKQRVDDQLNWYEKKSAHNKQWYYRLQFITLLTAVAVPVVSLLSGTIEVRFFVALLGATAALAAGLLSMCQFRDQWLDYRSTAELLKFEKHMFVTRSSPYDKSTAFSLFVQRVETIIISENRSWQQKSFGTQPGSGEEVRADLLDNTATGSDQ